MGGRQVKSTKIVPCVLMINAFHFTIFIEILFTLFTLYVSAMSFIHITQYMNNYPMDAWLLSHRQLSVLRGHLLLFQIDSVLEISGSYKAKFRKQNKTKCLLIK